MLRIRLKRVGKKNTPVYRVVVADQRKAVKRKFIEILGYYHPAATPKQVVIDKDKALRWLSQGAQATNTVNNLMCDLGILPKKEKISKVFGKKTKKKDEGKETAAEPKAEKVEEKETPAATEVTEGEGKPDQDTETTEPAEPTEDEQPAAQAEPAEVEKSE